MGFLMRDRSATLLTLCLAGACAACSSSEDEACKGDFPEAPPGAAAQVFVAAGCDGDGSREKPFGRVQQGVEAASKGAAVLVTPGSYAENVRITTDDVWLIGSSDGADADAAGIIIQAPQPHAVTVDGALGVTLRGLHIVDAAGSGVWVSGGGATLEGSRVEGTTAPEAAPFGYGVLASSGADLMLKTSVVSGSAGVGVLVSGAHGIIIQNQITGNGAGGVRVESSSGDVRVEANTLDANVEVGVGYFSSHGIIIQNQIKGTLRGDLAGDGVIVASLAGAATASNVEVRDNTVETSTRVGVLFGAGSRGIIIQNVARENGSKEAGIGAGIWVQGTPGDAAGLDIEKNEITGNRFVGLALTAGARGIIIQNTASGTTAGSVPLGVDIAEIGDGIGVFAGSSASIEQANVIENNFRAGILVSDADGAATSIKGNSVRGNEHGIIIQNEGTDTVDAADGANTVETNTAGDAIEHVTDQYYVEDDALGESGDGAEPPH